MVEPAVSNYIVVRFRGLIGGNLLMGLFFKNWQLMCDSFGNAEIHTCINPYVKNNHCIVIFCDLHEKYCSNHVNLYSQRYGMFANCLLTLNLKTPIHILDTFQQHWQTFEAVWFKWNMNVLNWAQSGGWI